MMAFLCFRSENVGFISAARVLSFSVESGRFWREAQYEGPDFKFRRTSLYNI